MPVPPNPNVTIYFYGIAVMCFDDNKLCQIGIQTDCDDHDLKISVISKYPNPVPATLAKYTFSHEAIRKSADITLYVEPTESADDVVANNVVANNVVERYCPKDKEGQCVPFNRDPLKDDLQDFRWVIDLESDVFDRELKLQAAKFKPCLYMNRGLFYTSVLSEGEFKLQAPSTVTAPTKPLGRVASYVAANISIEKGGQFVLKAGGMEIFRARYDEDEDFETTYEIVVDNSESHSYSEKVIGGIIGFQNENHLQYYYDGIEMTRNDVPYLIKPVPAPHLGDFFPPCSSAWLSKTKRF